MPQKPGAKEFAGRPVFSDYTRQLLRKQRRIHSSFFDKLPYKKLVELLKRTEGCCEFNIEAAHTISDDLNLKHSPRVFHWLRAKCRRNIKARKKPQLTKEKLGLLNAELQKSNKLDYGRALYLAHILTVPVAVVQNWFNAKAAGRSGRARESSLKPPKATSSAVQPAWNM